MYNFKRPVQSQLIKGGKQSQAALIKQMQAAPALAKAPYLACAVSPPQDLQSFALFNPTFLEKYLPETHK